MHSSLVLAASLTLLFRLPLLVGGAATNTTRTTVTPGKSHSLPESYQFDARDGWESVMATNLRYKYRRSPVLGFTSATTGTNSSNALDRPSSTNSKHSYSKNVFRYVRQTLADFTNSIMGSGDFEPVTITWYTGHDLLNPSCWTDIAWAPTDSSFVAAVTLEGWSERPKCFKFIELCSDHTKCTFARVVDTCAGCKKGTKHVDLTQAAFKQLASLDQGLLTVQMRQASDPTIWSEELWGPKHP